VDDGRHVALTADDNIVLAAGDRETQPSILSFGLFSFACGDAFFVVSAQ
jgi:hypothetical protein